MKSDRGRRNEVTLLAPSGKFLGVYGKDHPGTFAGDYSDTGGSFPVYRTDFGTIASIICYDLDFTDTARNVVRGGARLIAASSSDVKPLADIHYTHLVFRGDREPCPDHQGRQPVRLGDHRLVRTAGARDDEPAGRAAHAAGRRGARIG